MAELVSDHVFYPWTPGGAQLKLLREPNNHCVTCGQKAEVHTRSAYKFPTKLQRNESYKGEWAQGVSGNGEFFDAQLSVTS